MVGARVGDNRRRIAAKTVPLSVACPREKPSWSDDERARLFRFVAGKLGAEPRPSAPPPQASEIKLRAPRVSAPASLARVLTDEPYERLLHTYGKSYPETVRAFARDFSRRNCVSVNSISRQISAAGCSFK